MLINRRSNALTIIDVLIIIAILVATVAYSSRPIEIIAQRIIHDEQFFACDTRQSQVDCEKFYLIPSNCQTWTDGCNDWKRTPMGTLVTAMGCGPKPVKITCLHYFS